MKLTGRTVVVTGAASGIGRALAHALHQRGARLVITDRDAETLEASAAELSATAVPMDVASAEDNERLLSIAGIPTLLCLNAGVVSTETGPVWETSVTEWRRVLDVNLGGVVNGLRTFVPRMLATGETHHVLITASLAGLATWPGGGPYAASKHAVITVAEQAALALAEHPITVTVLCPALVRSGMSTEGADPADVAAQALEAVEQERFTVVPEAWTAAIEQRARRLASGRSPELPQPTTSEPSRASPDRGDPADQPPPDDARLLLDEDGTRVGWTVVDHRGDPTRAEPLVRSPHVHARRFAGVVAADLAGMRVATSDREVADALIDAGGHLVRRASVMVADPTEPAAPVNALPRPYEIVPFDSLPHVPEELAAQLADTRLHAYPASHPDHVPAEATHDAVRSELRGLLDGSALGPVHRELSAIVRKLGSDQPVGAIIVTMAAADAIWAGGPWIADLFIHPDHSGNRLGRHLLEHALTGCAHLGLPRIGLAVTHTNPAVRLYRTLGFTDVVSSWAIHLP